MTAQVRIALGRAIVQQIFPTGNELPVATLDAKLERLLLQTLQGNGAEGMAMEPGLADTIAAQTEQPHSIINNWGSHQFCWCQDLCVSYLSRFLRRTLPHRVLSHSELPENKTIRVTGLVGGQT